MFYLSIKKGSVFIFESFMAKNHQKYLRWLLIVDKPLEDLSQRVHVYLKVLLETINCVSLETELHKQEQD